jgi:hypothetical protein
LITVPGVVLVIFNAVSPKAGIGLHSLPLTFGYMQNTGLE